MTAIVFEGVPIPKRAGGRASEGLAAQLQRLAVGEMLFVPNVTSRNTSATVARITRATSRKFTTRKIAVLGKEVVEANTPKAVNGVGIWRES